MIFNVQIYCFVKGFIMIKDFKGLCFFGVFVFFIVFFVFVVCGGVEGDVFLDGDVGIGSFGVQMLDDFL